MLKPSSEVELAEVVAGAQGPLAVRGGGTRGMAVPGDEVSVAGLSGVSLYEPGALTLVAGAGTPVSEVERALAEGGQMLAFEPMDHRVLLGTSGEPTIGGMAAANVSGPRRVQAGACRDAMLGVRFVDGSGAVVANGGRVMKNVTGYDLVKLMAGSYGTLGVLSEVALKVLPKPETAATVLVHGLDTSDAVGAMAAALGSPFDVTGAAHVPTQGQTLVRVEGFEASVGYRAERLKEILGTFGEVTLADGAVWQDVRDVAPLAEAAAVWRLSIRPSAVPALAESLAACADVEMLFDWGGGRVWVGSDQSDAVMHSTVLAAASAAGGHGVRVKGPAGSIADRFSPRADGVAHLEAGLRARFDPRGILNAGLMGAAA